MYAGLSEVLEREQDVTEEEYEMFHAIIDLVPTFEPVLLRFVEDPPLLAEFVAKLASTADSARQEDTGSIRYTALAYIPFDPENDTINPPITKQSAKSSRGFNHPATARLLCPFKRLREFDDDPMAFMTKVNDGQISIKASAWPSFMYDVDMFEEGHIEKGLCRGYFLVRVFRHVFTGPSSAISKTSRASKPSKAQLHGLTEVTGRTIAYAAVQARFMLCTIEQWKRYDGNFDHDAFYKNIVQMFERRPNHRWVRETLAWWNKECPGLTQRTNKRKRAARNPDQNSSDEEAVNEIFEQWGSEPEQQERDERDDTPGGHHQEDEEEEEDHQQPPRTRRLANNQHLHHDDRHDRLQNDRSGHRRRDENMEPRLDGRRERRDQEQVQERPAQRSPRQHHDARHRDDDRVTAHAEPPRYRRNRSSSRSTTPMKHGKHSSRHESERDDEEPESPPPKRAGRLYKRT